jgi:hypothetical protein
MQARLFQELVSPLLSFLFIVLLRCYSVRHCVVHASLISVAAVWPCDVPQLWQVVTTHHASSSHIHSGAGDGCVLWCTHWLDGFGVVIRCNPFPLLHPPFHSAEGVFTCCSCIVCGSGCGSIVLLDHTV